MVLQEHGISPKKVDFVPAQKGFPAMPGQLQDGAWDAAFLAEPYITLAAEDYGDQELTDLDEGSTLNFPVDGYVATLAWAQKNPKTGGRVRAGDRGGTGAGQQRSGYRPGGRGEVRPQLPPEVTALIALPGFPSGPVAKTQIQRVAAAMLQFGLLSKEYTAEVRQGTLVESMIGPAS